ncbi:MULTISPECIES: AraC family transcriptional regulator [unclassified Beijerinckia]|uniref:AraC family transcriptional regulator n=1 Tax=unclassified Beijerinckia TaxID=2638183 RepID=UPI000895F2FB|nr:MULTISPECIES: AraC family transcriptional regulator [unclassified Beijerinckia]MDH7794894.1 AraC-like DNA-binding protein [Beijerinckia sp. GAS462]SEB79568.1 AraC-type DNA-binding protein [Beijerinckia sp. 28-YEA-48]
MDMRAYLLEELRTLIARHAAPGESRTTLPNIVLSASTLPTEPTAHMADPAFAIIAQGAKRVVLGDQVLVYAAGQYLVYSVTLPLSAHVIEASEEGPLLGLGLTLRPEAIAALLLETGAAPRNKVEQRGIAVSDVTADLLDPVVRLLRLLDRPQDIPVLAQAIEREILWRLINDQQGAMVRQLGLADSRMTQIGRAIAWIRSHYTETIRIEDLAAVAGMSATSLHRHFRAVTSLSPLQFQKQIRLDTARTRLLSSSQDVAYIGLTVGYDSPSQFSREYRRLFGHPPGRDGASLRKSKVGAT